MRILNFLLLALSINLLSCSTLFRERGNKVSYSEFRELKVGGMTQKEVSAKLGKPSKSYFLGTDNQLVDKSSKAQWIYQFQDLDILYLFFENGVLTSKTWNMSEKESLGSVKKALADFKSNWAVIPEPKRNPHAGPTECYLEDLSNGKLIKVHGYNRVVSEISIWVPSKGDKSIKKDLYINSGKEFCIAGRCSRVTDPSDRQPNHCQWLEVLAAKYGK